MTEKYYSIRIGLPRKHQPYLMLSENQETPAIFKTKSEAVSFLEKNPGFHRKVVVVVISYN